MAQHISRRDLKKDEVRETFAHGADAVLSHQSLTAYILLAAIVIALGIFGWRTYAERQTVKASAAFGDAMKTFQARVRAPGEPAEPTEVTYVDQKNKWADAAQKFHDVAAKYPRTRPGQLANYYSGLSLERIDRYDDAKKALQAAVDGGSDDYAALARFELAQLDDRTGQGDEAVKIYEQLIAKPAVFIPKSVVMLALAEHYSQKNPAEAAKVYGQIKTEFPGTPMAQQADQELALLPGKS